MTAAHVCNPGLDVQAERQSRTAGAAVDGLVELIHARSARIGIVGLGYVGLPLALAFSEAGYAVTGFDIDQRKLDRLAAGESYIGSVTSEAVAAAVGSRNLRPAADFDELAQMDCVLICVPTPLGANRDPDMSFVVATAEAVALRLRRGQLVVLESSTYPGTTEELVQPILEKTGQASGVDFFLAFSPEREDPGNGRYTTRDIPKVVSGHGEEARRAAVELYKTITASVRPVSSTRVAEMSKLLENIFRAVNIALVNELKLICDEMGVDVWEVIAAAETKPFGFMPFYPGPGLGGHCIPIDPFYLTWKAREFGLSTRLIELAGEINTAMPDYVVSRLADALNMRFAKAMNGARILVLGVAYKRNIDDVRESPGLRLIELCEARGAAADFHDPHVPVIPPTREHAALGGRRSVDLTSETAAGYDAIVISADHDAVDYEIVAGARLVVDTRNAIASRLGERAARSIVKA